MDLTLYYLVYVTLNLVRFACIKKKVRFASIPSNYKKNIKNIALESVSIVYCSLNNQLSIII